MVQRQGAGSGGAASCSSVVLGVGPVQQRGAESVGAATCPSVVLGVEVEQQVGAESVGSSYGGRCGGGAVCLKRITRYSHTVRGRPQGKHSTTTVAIDF